MADMSILKPSFTIAGASLLALAVMAMSLGHGFVNYDDNLLILENPHIVSQEIDGLAALLVPERAREYLPVRDVSYWLDYRIWGPNPMGFHFTQILLHAVVTGLFVCFLSLYVLPIIGDGRGTGGKSKRGSPQAMLFVWIAGVLFAVHPIHVETVAWISGRKDLLAATFSFATLLLYGHWVRRSQPTSYWLSVVTTGLAVFAKSTAVVLPVLIVIAHRTLWRAGSKRSANLTRITPHLIFAAVGLVLAIRSSSEAGMLQGLHGGGLLAHLLVVCRIFVHSLGNLILPLRLHLDYDILTKGVLDSAWSYVAAAVTLGLLVALYRRGRGNRVVFWSSTFFLVAYLPTSNLVPFQLYGADRYLYLPSAGFLALVSYGVFVLWRRLARVQDTAGLRKGLVGVVCFYIVFLSVSTVAHTPVWKDRETLWLHVLRGNPESIPANDNLGWVYLAQGRYDKALPHIEKTVRLDPGNVAAQVNLGYGLVKVGRPRDAIRVLESAMRQDPDHVNTYYNLGCAYAVMGDGEEAVTWIRKAESLGLEVGDLLKNDPDLDPIRGHEAFEEYLRSHE